MTRCRLCSSKAVSPEGLCEGCAAFEEQHRSTPFTKAERIDEPEWMTRARMEQARASLEKDAQDIKARMYYGLR